MQRVMAVAQGHRLGHLQRCSISGLFGRRDIEFETAAAGPTLLYGQNGTGKSTILRLIDEISGARWLTVMERPFRRIELWFDSGARLAVSSERGALTLVLNDERWSLTAEMVQAALQRMEARSRREIELGRPLGVYAQRQLFREDELVGTPDWVFGMRAIFPVFLIEDQRLVLKHAGTQASEVRASGAHQQSAVSRYPKQLQRQIEHAFSAYGTHSQELDRRFPMKLADAVEAQETRGEKPGAIQHLRELLTRVREERQALERVGLLGSDEQSVQFDARRLEAERVRPVIRAFAEDTLAKFEVLRDLRVRLEVFAAFLNQHYQGKRVITSRKQGFAVVLDDGAVLPTWQLSSGEQQVLALAFQILFRTTQGTLILIDEPELSLHVLWQSTLIEDLVAMGKARDVSFILATHSPTLIGDRVELMRSLDPLPEQEYGPTRIAHGDARYGSDKGIDEDELEGGFGELDEFSDATDAR